MIVNTIFNLKILFVILFYLNVQILTAQDYIDLFKINYAKVPSSGFEEVDGDNTADLFDVSLTYPIKLNDKTAVITGLDYIQQTLKLAPNTSNIDLNNITVKAGLNIKHSSTLSGTYILLPRISSENLHTEGNHLFFGGAVVLKYQKSERFQWRFGAYASTEAFGVLATPIVGLYFKSKNDKLEITANLPINLDVNYRIEDKISIGLGLLTPVKTYSIEPEEGITDRYVQVANIEFGPYLEYQFFDNSLLLRAQVGYESLSYELFNEGDELPFRLSAIEFGDDRELLNPDLAGSLFLKIGAIYRFHLNK